MLKYLLLVPLLLVGCNSSTPSVQCPTPAAAAPCPSSSGSTQTSSTTSSTSLDACGLGQQNLLKLGCKDERGLVIGSPDLHGVTWAAICRANATHSVDMKPACMAAAANCAEVEACR